MNAISVEGEAMQLGPGAMVYLKQLPYPLEDLKARVLQSDEVYLISLNPKACHGSGECMHIAEKVVVSAHQDTVWKQATTAYALFIPRKVQAI